MRFLSCFVTLGAVALSVAVSHDILRDPGMDCSASESRIDRGCSQAMDGRSEALTKMEGRWCSKTGAGAWITFKFPMAYKITHVRLMQKLSKRAQFKDVDLEFSGSAKQRFTLSKRTGNNYHDDRGRWWDELDIQDVTATYMTVRAISHYTKYYNGFQEVEIIGEPAPGETLPHNLLRDPGVLCSASSSRPGRDCTQAMDGRSFPMVENVGRWATTGGGAGAWIKFDFGKSCTITKVRVMQKLYKGEQFKDVDLEFSDYSKQRFTLTQRTGINYHDENGRWWDELNIQPVTSTYLTIRTLSHYTKRYNGFTEVEVIGEPGPPPTPAPTPAPTAAATPLPTTEDPDDTGVVTEEGCKLMGQTHLAGETWMQALKEGRNRECYCPDPLPTSWNRRDDCIGACYVDGSIVYAGAKYTRSINGVMTDCRCNDYGKERCR